MRPYSISARIDELLPTPNDFRCSVSLSLIATPGPAQSEADKESDMKTCFLPPRRPPALSRLRLCRRERHPVRRLRLPGYQFPAKNAPSVPTTAPNGQTVHTYVTQSGRGTWLFPPTGNAGGNS